jgi:predicted  nucleic acid-binding Zn-ribbon protein
MKQKLILIATSFLLALNISSNAFSLDLEKELNKVTGGKSSSLSKSIKEVGSIDKKIEQAIAKVQDQTLGKVDEKINEITQKVEGEIEGVKAKIEAEEAKIREIIAEAEDGINKFREIKAKAEKYVGMIKMVVGFLSLGIVGILFFLFKVWRNIVGFKKLIKNVTNYDAIKNQLEALENKVAELEGDKVAHEVEVDGVDIAEKTAA